MLSWPGRLVRLLRSRPRLFGSMALASVAYVSLPAGLAHHASTRLVMAWNMGAMVYLALAMHMMFGSNHERMRQRATQHDEGRWLVLLMVVVAAVVCLGAIVAELGRHKDASNGLRDLHIALAALTLATSWLFTQTMFALHYAHDYYVALMRQGTGGLEFPGGHAPDYGDFLYFSCVIGTSGQTADVSLTSRAMRRIGTVHCVLAFFFNTTVVALTINIASGLI